MVEVLSAMKCGVSYTGRSFLLLHGLSIFQPHLIFLLETQIMFIFAFKYFEDLAQIKLSLIGNTSPAISILSPVCAEMQSVT